MIIALLGMNYRKITDTIRQKLKPKEAYTFLGLVFKSDYESYESSVNEETLADFLKIPRDRVIDHIEKFTDTDLIYKEQKQYGFRKKNYYKVNTDHYFLVTDKIFSLDITGDDIGFLLILKACCINNTNLCKWSINQLVENVAISKPTVLKYLKRLEDKDIISRKDGKIKIIKEGIFVETQPTDIAVMRNFYPEALDEDDFDRKGNFIKSYGK